MPTLNWIGKDAVMDHHRRVPARLLECDPKLSFGDPDAEILLVEDDNLEPLEALMPRYRGIQLAMLDRRHELSALVRTMVQDRARGQLRKAAQFLFEDHSEIV